MIPSCGMNFSQEFYSQETRMRLINLGKIELVRIAEGPEKINLNNKEKHLIKGKIKDILLVKLEA